MMNKEGYDFTGDYKRKFEEYVDEVEAYGDFFERTYRMELMDELLSAYVEQTGKTPDPKELQRLSDVCLHEELTDKRKNKMQLYEYPIMSDSQYERRVNGRHTRRNKTDTTDMEVPLEHGSNVATDGNNYTTARRSFSNEW